VGVAVVLDTNVFINVKNREEPYYPFSKRVLDWIDEGAMNGIVSRSCCRNVLRILWVK
jgi:predicted nucleic acid-binding protein